jgi:cysteinyl-tRNA synthetase
MEDEKISDSSNDKLEGTVNMLIEMRKQARDKNFALSDQIRDQLIALGCSKTVKKELLLYLSSNCYTNQL